MTCKIPKLCMSFSFGIPGKNQRFFTRIHRLDPIDWNEVLDAESFNQEAINAGASEVAEENQYVILTKKDNIVHNGEYLSDSLTESGFSYYLVSGIPEITLQFPITELVIVIILVIIIVRLLFKKSDEELQEEQAKKLRKDIEKKIFVRLNK
jgi:hypothetical protein